MNFATPKNKYIKGIAHIGAFITVAVWGTSFLSTKVLMTDGGLSPVEVYIYRFILAYLILLAFTFKKIRSQSWRDELTFLLCGICCGSLYFITENYALRLTSTGNVSLLSCLSPIFTTFIMALIFRQRIQLGVLVGSVIAFGGAALIIFSHGESLEFNPAGDLLALSSAMSWAIYSVAIKPLLPRYNSMLITRKLFLYGVITALPFLILQKEPLRLSVIFNFSQPQMMLNLLFLVVFCSIVAYLLWNEVMKYLGPVVTNNYLYLQPLVTMVAAFFILHEQIYLLGYIGCALIIGGLVCTDKLKLGRDRLK